MKDMATWNEGDWIAAIAAVFLFAFLAIGAMIASRKSDQVVGHPRGLFVLFYAEMWERFSYYGMRALLVLYLTKHWLYSDSQSNLIYGAYGALVYITPVLGGLATRTRPQFPAFCAQSAPAARLEGAALVAESVLTCSRDLPGNMVGLSGMDAAFTDALLRVAPLGRPVQAARLTPRQAMV